MPDHSVVELQVMAFEALADLCESLTPAQWSMDTDCPGWNVQDNISHIVGTESTLLGRQAPAHDPGEKDWIKNPIGANNEVHVDYRRSWSAQQVLEEYREVIGERIGAIRSVSEDDLDAESWTPIGPGKVRDLLAIRIMDVWVHEQDIRRATGNPGGLEGPVASHVFSRHQSAIPFVVGKKAGAADGSTVVFDVVGQEPFAVGVETKRASLLDVLPASPDVTLSMDLETFSRLCTGRGDVDALAKTVTVEGDQELGLRVLAEQNFMI